MGVIDQLAADLKKKGVAKRAVAEGNGGRTVFFNAARKAGVKITTRVDGDFVVAEVVKGGARKTAAKKTTSKKTSKTKAATTGKAKRRSRAA